MATTIRRTVLAALAAAMVVACTAQTEAQIRFRLRPTVRLAPRVVVTTPSVSYSAPYLGFSSYFDGSGEQLTAVQYGAAAWRIGLEPGDKILAVNGVPIRYHGHGLQLLRAASVHGQVSLSVLDRRTGLVAHRTIVLGSSTTAHSSASYIVSPSHIGHIGHPSYAIQHSYRSSRRIPRRFPH